MRIYTQFLRKIAFAATLVALLAGGAGALQFTLGTAVGNPGDTAEVPVTLSSVGVSPTTFILWIKYDHLRLTPDETYFQFTQNNPITGGTPTTTTSFARPSASVTNSERFVSTNVTQPGTLVVIVAGGPETTVPDGIVLTLAFKISANAADGETLELNGLVVGEHDSGTASSAADGNTQSIPVEIADGSILVGCSSAPDVTGVTATSERSDGVVISWETLPAEGTEYRVYRNSVNNPGTATPLGEGWSAATSFLDVTAASPTINDPGGCFRPVDATFVSYFYWVKARTSGGCVSQNFSTPAAQGSRALANKLGGAVAPKTLPFEHTAASSIFVSPDSSLSVRLDAGDGDAVDADTVWAKVQGDDWLAETVAVTPANERGAVWVTVNPETHWTPGEMITFETGAYAVSGAPVGPYVVEFVVVQEGKTVAASPVLREGVGDVFDITPQGVYTTPQVVLLPVPAGHNAQSLEIYSLVHGAWSLAQDVDGLLVSRETVVQEGRQFVGLTLRHSATLQLGVAPMPEAPLPNKTAMTGGTLSSRQFADLAMMLMVIALLAGLMRSPVSLRK